MTITSVDFLNYSLGVGFLVLVGFLSFLAVYFSQTLKRLTSVLIKIDDIAKDADDLKNHIKLGILNLMSAILKMGGEKKK